MGACAKLFCILPTQETLGTQGFSNPWEEWEEWELISIVNMCPRARAHM
jgi:hypothetical protein